MKTATRTQENQKLYDRFILGLDEGCWVSTNPKETQLNNNILVVGGSGSGKSTSIIMPILLHLKHSNAVGVFTKRSVMDKMACAMRKHGYTVRIIDFADPEKSEFGFDPLLYCQTTADVKSLAHAIIHADPRSREIRDRYWYDSAENLLNVVLRYVWDGHYVGGRSMTAALKLLDGVIWAEKNSDWYDGWWESKEDSEKRKKKRDEEFARCYPTHKEMERLEQVDPVGDVTWKSFIRLSRETAACYVSIMQTALGKVFQGDVRKILSLSKMYDFKELAKPRQVLFLYMSPVSTAQYRYTSLFYQQVFKSLFEFAEEQESYCLPYPVHVLCDDFATGCKIEGFADLISIFREKGISATMLLQSESQLAGLYGMNEAKTIINNCDTYIYLGGMDIKTCGRISRWLNLPLSDVLSMPLGKEYFFRRGQKPIATERYNTLDDSAYTSLFG